MNIQAGKLVVSKSCIKGLVDYEDLKGEPQIPCTECERTFRHHGHLVRHIKLTHKEIRLPMCDVCFKSFSCDADLSKHRRQHKKGQVYHCKSCGQKVVYISGFMVHACLHKCPLCNKTFNSKISKELHIKEHSKSNASREADTQMSPTKYCLKLLSEADPSKFLNSDAVFDFLDRIS